MVLNNKLENLVDELKSKSHLGSVMQSVINNSYQDNSTYCSSTEKYFY